MFNWKQIYLTTIANLKARYRNTFAGFIWVILLPLLTYLAQAYAFKVVLKIEMENYYLFLLTGLLPWIFLHSSVDICTGLYVNHGRLLKSFPISPINLLCAQILDNFFNFVVSFLVLLLPLAYFSKVPFERLLLFPLCAFSLVNAVFGLCWMLATMNVFLRDIRFVVGFAFTISFYLTPIFYSISFIPLEQRWIVDYNPLYYLVMPFQFISRTEPISQFWPVLLHSVLVSLGLVLVAALLWAKQKNELFKTL